jgi:hypothetical protein
VQAELGPNAAGSTDDRRLAFRLVIASVSGIGGATLCYLVMRRTTLGQRFDSTAYAGSLPINPAVLGGNELRRITGDSLAVVLVLLVLIGFVLGGARRYRQQLREDDARRLLGAFGVHIEPGGVGRHSRCARPIPGPTPPSRRASLFDMRYSAPGLQLVGPPAVVDSREVGAPGDKPAVRLAGDLSLGPVSTPQARRGQDQRVDGDGGLAERELELGHGHRERSGEKVVGASRPPGPEADHFRANGRLRPPKSRSPRSAERTRWSPGAASDW